MVAGACAALLTACADGGESLSCGSEFGLASVVVGKDHYIAKFATPDLTKYFYGYSDATTAPAALNRVQTAAYEFCKSGKNDFTFGPAESSDLRTAFTCMGKDQHVHVEADENSVTMMGKDFQTTKFSKPMNEVLPKATELCLGQS